MVLYGHGWVDIEVIYRLRLPRMTKTRRSQGPYEYGKVEEAEHDLILEGLRYLESSLHDEMGKLAQMKLSRKEGGLEDVVETANRLLLSIKILNRLQARLEAIAEAPDSPKIDD